MKSLIDTNKINKTEQELIARSFLLMVEDYFSDTEVQQKFNIWLKKRKKLHT